MIKRGVGEVQLVVRAAASADPQIAELWADLKRQRLVGATRMATHLAEAAYYATTSPSTAPAT